MNLNIRYDLLEEAAVANKGFSLKRYTKKVLTATAIGTTILLPIRTIDGISIKEAIDTIVLNLEIYAGIYGFYSVISKQIEQDIAKTTLSLLSSKLSRNNINITQAMLQSVKKDKTKYSLSYSTFPPEVKQKKYISISNSCDMKETLLQEHIIGTKNYDLSYGEPEREKVCSYQKKRAINK